MDFEKKLRGKRVALQFSGGKDSLALLFYLRNYASLFTVYCLRQEEIFPEVQEAIDWAKTVALNFIEVYSKRPENTLVTDLLPVEESMFGKMILESKGVSLIDRYSCCYATIMAPLHQRMIEDGIELIIRGQKDADGHKGPMKDSMKFQGIEYWLPFENWTDQRVMLLLRMSNAPVPGGYENGLKGGLDCVGCTAWWEEKRLPYLRKAYPTIAIRTEQDLQRIYALTKPTIDQLLEAVNG